jgi:hypothetical protein
MFFAWLESHMSIEGGENSHPKERLHPVIFVERKHSNYLC